MTTRVPDLASHLADTVRRTIIECSLTSEPQPALPPPNDVEAERMVIGALLCGEVGIAELGELTHEHMFLELHRWVMTQIEHCSAAGLDPAVGLLCAAAEREGISADFLRPELEDLRSREWVSPARARECAHRIITLSDSRSILDRTARIMVALRTGTVTPGQARKGLLRIGGIE